MAPQREWFEKDYYKVLGVVSTATDKEITRAYRKLAKQYHPDANPGSEDRFKEIASAYDVLGDADQRKEYDEVRRLGPMAARCHTCNGTGAAPGTGTHTCDRCGGRGTLDDNQGLFSLSTVCPKCNGRGTLVDTPCPTCHGTGVERRNRQVKVRVPAGVENGQRIRVKGRGARGQGMAPPGDLYVVVHVDKHPKFGRRGRN